MKKKLLILILQIIGTAICSWLLNHITPWWIFTIVCFISGILVLRNGFLSFIGGFLGTAIYYFGACLHSSWNDNFTFAGEIAQIIGEPLGLHLSGFSLLCIGTLLYGLLGGFFSWSATLIFSGKSNKQSNKSVFSKGTDRLKLDLK